MTFPIPDAALAQHIAALGKTGSGKTTTAKLIVERLVAQGARVCILDPIKSDWWGLTSSADGKHPGLPFHILGGPRGHVPLHAGAGAAIGELVATGALPLSIIDMADFGPGGIQGFFNDFAPALMRRAEGILHLVLEEAHEFAPKERAGIGNENMSIHYAKKLATAGRSKGIRLIVLTQSVQQLHNRVLGSCETMIAHRFTTPADQKPVKDWLKANMDKDTYERVADSMASLKTGTGWVCSGELQIAQLSHFPRLTTFDNSATPSASRDKIDVKTAHVDQERLRAIIGEAVKEAEANDPKVLKAEISRLTRELAAKGQVRASEEAIDEAHHQGERDGFTRGHTEGKVDGYREGHAAGKAALAVDLHRFLSAVHQNLGEIISEIAPGVNFEKLTADQVLRHLQRIEHRPKVADPMIQADVAQRPEPRSSKPEMTGSSPAVRSKSPRAPREGLHPAAEKMARALGRNPKRMFTWEQAGIIAGILPGNGYFYGGKKDLLVNELVVERDGRVSLGPKGDAYRGDPEITPKEIVEIWSAKLKAPAASMLGHLFTNRPDWIKTDDLAAAINAKPGNGYWYGGVKALRVAGLIEEMKGAMRVSEILQ